MKKTTLLLPGRLFTLLTLLLTSLTLPGRAQISYTQNFSGTSGWSGTPSAAPAGMCSTPGAIGISMPTQFNIYTAYSGSPNIGGASNNGGNLTVTYQYMIRDFNLPSAPYLAASKEACSFTLQYAAAASGPWITVQKVGTNHEPSLSCATKTVSFFPALPAGSPLYIRFFVTWTSGAYNIYFDDVSVTQGAAPAVCTGAPSIGTAQATNYVVAGTNGSAELSLSALPTDGTDVAYQWESSSDNITYTPVPGAATSNYYATGIAADTWFRCVATCTASSQSTTSNPVMIHSLTPLTSFNVTHQSGIPFNSIAPAGSSSSFNSNVPIGFPFAFMGNVYNSVSASPYGWLSFLGGGGISTNTTEFANGIRSKYAPAAMLVPFWAFLNNMSSFKYQVSGTAPNRVFVAEWAGMQNQYSNGSVLFSNVCFQARLYEGSNKIEYAYGPMDAYGRFQTGISTYYYPAYQYTTGLRNSTTDFISLKAANSDYFVSSLPNDTLNVLPECNSLLTFTPAATFTAGTAPASVVPANDNSANAIVLTVNNGPCDNNCGNYYSSANATPSPEASDCAAANDDDVWFKFTNTTTQTIRVNILGSDKYKPVATLLDASFTAVAGNNCLFLPTNADYLTATALPPGTYYVRVSANGAGSGNGVFSICVSAPPANDECSAAIPLTVSSGFPSDPIIGNISFATASAGVPASTGCTTSLNEDIWYSVAIPATGNVVVQMNGQTSSGGSTDYVMQALTGTCGTLTNLACSTSGGNSFGNSLPKLFLTGQLPGSTVFLRIRKKSNSADAKFLISAYDTTTSVSPAIAAGGACAPQNTITINTENGNKYRWVPIFDGSNRIAAELYANGNELGNVAVSVHVNTGTVRMGANGYYMDRSLTITPDRQPTSAVQVRLYYTQAELAALAAVNVNAMPSNLQVLKNSDACGNAIIASPSVFTPTAYGAYNGGNYLQLGVTSFSSFFFIPVNPLPVALSSFTGKNEGTTNLLSWTTASEKNFSRFELQRSADGTDFKKIATISSHKKEAGSSYNYTDNEPYTGRNFYRLVMIDVDGTTAISSQVVALNVAAGSGLSINAHPNPVKQQLQIDVAGSISGQAQVQVVDMLGKIVRTVNVSGSHMTLDMSGMPAGNYLIRYKDSNHTSVIKITKN